MHTDAIRGLSLRRLPALCTLLASLCTAQAALAASYAARSEVWILDSLTQSAVAGQGDVASSVDSVADNLGSTRATAWAWSDTAGIHLDATSSSDVVGGPTLIYSRSFARGNFSDEFVLQSPSQTIGAAGTAIVAFSISGSLYGTTYGGGGDNDGLGGGGYSRWDAGFELYGQNDGVRWEGWQSLTVEQDGRSIWGGPALPGVQTFAVPVIFGDTLRLSIFALLEAASGAQAVFAGPGATGSAQSAHFMNTMAWGGILAVVDAQGAAVTDFSALSASTGFDYAAAYTSPVPEPATAWMLLAGGLGLAELVRRRSRRAAAL